MGTMRAIPCNPNRGRRYRVGDFISIMKEEVDIEAAQEVARTLFHNIKQFLCVGYLRIYVDDESLCPLKEYDVQRETIHQLVLFVLKKYDSHITMTFFPELLAFQRVIGANATTLYKYNARRR